MRITITGATGLIGRRLVEKLLADHHELHVLGRTPRARMPTPVRFHVWDAMQGELPEESLAGSEAVLHLAGEPIAQRWSPDVKRRIQASRMEGTRRLVQAIGRLSARPAALISSSAIGIYGDRGDEVLTEQSRPGDGFLADVCKDWEKAAREAEGLGVRVACVRTGVVLGHGGALSRMLPPFRAGFGGRIGSGQQWMSWIHIEDLIGILCRALSDSRFKGAINGTTPNPVRNQEFTRVLARTLRRPAFFPVPVFALKLMFGEMSQVLLASQRVLPRAAEQAEYEFRFPELQSALTDLLS